MRLSSVVSSSCASLKLPRTYRRCSFAKHERALGNRVDVHAQAKRTQVVEEVGTEQGLAVLTP